MSGTGNLVNLLSASEVVTQRTYGSVLKQRTYVFVFMPTDKCSSPHPSPRKTSLQQTETITDTHNPSKCSIVESSPNEYIYKTFLHLMLKELLYKVARL